MNEKFDITLTINGRDYPIRVEPRHTLVDAIRDDCGQTGTHIGCEHGVCGTCTIIVDGEAVRSCLMFAVQAQAKRSAPSKVSPTATSCIVLQRAFIENHGLQCGYCTPGFLMLATNVLEKNPHIADEELIDVLSSNLCRCTGYQNIIKAVRAAAKEMREARSGYKLERRQRRFRDFDILLDLGAAGGDRADDFAADLDRKAARHIGEVAHAHRHATAHSPRARSRSAGAARPR